MRWMARPLSVELEGFASISAADSFRGLANPMQKKIVDHFGADTLKAEVGSRVRFWKMGLVWRPVSTLRNFAFTQF